jgi:hypothetical protein
LCLREIGEAMGIEYDENKAVVWHFFLILSPFLNAKEILLSVSPEGSLNRNQFEGSFDSLFVD